MSEAFPISCTSCRRKKIKCNKLRPCNQCEKRGIRCEFPTTFRNIKINEEDLEYPHALASSSSLQEELEHTKNEKLSLFQENAQLTQLNQKLALELSKYSKSSLLESSANKIKDKSHDMSSAQGMRDPIPMSGETTETGEKYYGPQSSSFMIEKLKTYKSDEGVKTYKPEAIDKPYKSDEEEGSNIKKSILNKQINIDSVPEPKSANNSFNSSLVEQSLLKKPLPFLLRIDSDVSSDSDTFHESNRSNNDAIKRLVNLFFQNNSYCNTFISRKNVLEFLDNYSSIKDKEWENDDDLLLLYMILILSIHRLTPKEFVELDFISENSIRNYEKVKMHLAKNLLFRSFERLRHNLINESISTIQAYILCTEWHFIEQRYEECWSMMFHTCSIAYSIGIHVMGKFRFESNFERSEEEESDLARYKVWFALKHISGQICSILGRPNPVSIQVNSIVLRSSNESSAINLNKRKTQVLLKIGLSECLRLSNLMLIENFMIDFTINDLLKLDKKFDQEITLLEWFMRNEYLSDEDNDSSYNKSDELPLVIDKNNILIDLIVFYINRAKLFEPFLTKFQHEKEASTILVSLIRSILKFLELSTIFFESFLDSFLTEFFDDLPVSDIKFGRLFRIYFPFLNSFIYQGVIVIFTFLHYKFKDFVKNEEHTNNEFLQTLEMRLNDMLEIDTRMKVNYKSSARIWPTNIVYLINKILSHIKLIYESQNYEPTAPLELKDQSNSNSENFGVKRSEYEEFYGFNMNDPFWFTNPESLPYYLSSPSDDSSTKKYDINESGEGFSKNHQRQQSLPKQGLTHENLSSRNFDGQNLSGQRFAQQTLHPQPLHVQPQPQSAQFNLNTLGNTDFNTIYEEPTSSNLSVHAGIIHSQPISQPVLQNPYVFNSSTEEPINYDPEPLIKEGNLNDIQTKKKRKS